MRVCLRRVNRVGNSGAKTYSSKVDYWLNGICKNKGLLRKVDIYLNSTVKELKTY